MTFRIGWANQNLIEINYRVRTENKKLQAKSKSCSHDENLLNITYNLYDTQMADKAEKSVFIILIFSLLPGYYH